MHSMAMNQRTMLRTSIMTLVCHGVFAVARVVCNTLHEAYCDRACIMLLWLLCTPVSACATC